MNEKQNADIVKNLERIAAALESLDEHGIVTVPLEHEGGRLMIASGKMKGKLNGRA